MLTSENPRVVAEQSQRASRGLAHASRAIDDPTDVSTILGSLAAAAASLEQALHLLGASHDGPYATRASLDGDRRSGRAACYQVACELHRAAEMVRQVRAGIVRAHEIEATIIYEVPAVPASAAGRRPPQPGLSL